MGSQYIYLPFNSEVKWLLRGKILTRMFVYREELQMVQQQNNSRFQDLLSDDGYVAKLAHLAHIFSLLNNQNPSLRGHFNNVFIVRDEIDTFLKKYLWQTRLI